MAYSASGGEEVYSETHTCEPSEQRLTEIVKSFRKDADLTLGAWYLDHDAFDYEVEDSGEIRLLERVLEKLSVY